MNLLFISLYKNIYTNKLLVLRNSSILLLKNNVIFKVNNLNLNINKNELSFSVKHALNSKYNLFAINRYIYNVLLLISKVNRDGFIYIRNLFIILAVDATLTDDEPIWEPIEWSLIQTWLFFIFSFAWIAENLITSRFGSYNGRDKRIWFAWYKTFWLIELYYIISLGAAVLFVIVPFYYEITYTVSFIISWWDWYTRVFFFKFIALYSIIILLAYIFQISMRWLNWKKLFIMALVISFYIAYILYINFIVSFFAYFTDPLWYQKTRFIDYIQLSHEPLKWGWGSSKRDHFTYHHTPTVFWFKNDGAFAGAMLLLHLTMFLSLFFLYVYWLVLLRRIYSLKEVSYTYSTYAVSSLKQYFYFFLLIYILIFMSFLINYWRFPIEHQWAVNNNTWFLNFISILSDYMLFIWRI